MKIAATCDIHYDLLSSPERQSEFTSFLRALEAERPDVLVVAGDLVGLGWAKLGECLDLFAEVSPVRLMVFGNHDHWSANGDTPGHLERLRTIISKSGFRLLDAGPEIVGGVGFAGNSLWYDYSLAAAVPPAGASYEKKVFAGHILWNDFQFVKLGKSDEEYTEELLQRLEKDIAALETRTDVIVAVTHHVGFAEMLTARENDPAWNFCNAFMGTKKLGELLLAHPKVSHHVCGHTHDFKREQFEGLQAVNPGSTYTKKRYDIIEVSSGLR